MGKRGPRLRAAPGIAEIPAGEAAERPAIAWNRLVLTAAQAGEVLKCSPQSVNDRAARGDFPRYRVGGEWRYYAYDLLDYALANPDGRGGRG